MVKGKEIGRWFEPRTCSWFIVHRFEYDEIDKFATSYGDGSGIDKPNYQMIIDREKKYFFIIYEMSPREFDTYEGKIMDREVYYKHMDELGNMR